MGNNIFEKLKWNKKFVKLSMTALVSAIAVYGGMSYSAKAMKPTESVKTKEIVVTKTDNRIEELILQQGDDAFKAGNADQALEKYEEAVVLYGSEKSLKALTACYDYYSRINAPLPEPSTWRAVAMLKLGICYSHGKGVEQDKKEAFKWYEKAAALENPDAMYSLGACYSHGKGVEQDKKEAFKWYKKAAELENANAMYSLGRCYERGLEGVITQDKKQAYEWCKKAAALENPDAMYSLGRCYEHGLEGVITQDKKKAFELYQQAAALKNADAMYNLGRCYERGEGVAKNMTEAVRWYRQAAERGNALAMNNLGVWYGRGEGIAKNMTEAVRWYRQAAERGNAVAMNNLGVLYERGEGVTKNMTEAFKLYKQAADLGNKFAKMNMERLSKPSSTSESAVAKSTQPDSRVTAAEATHTDLSIPGRGVGGLGPTPTMPLGLRSIARVSGVLPARLASPILTPQDMKILADLGNVDAMCKLGEFYKRGIGVLQDKNQAAEWYKKAAKCYESGKGVPQDNKKAVELYKQAADLGHADAMCKLGECYERGEGVEKNMTEAFKLYKQAADLGNKFAKMSMKRLSKPSSVPASAGVIRSQPARATDAEQSKVTHTDQSNAKTSTEAVFPPIDSATVEPAAKRRETEKSTDGETEFKLGNCLWYGKTVKRNRAEAIEKYKIAVSLGNVRAMCKLGDIYMNGEEGVAEEDKNQAAEWYKKAAELGDIYAKDMLDILDATDVEER